VLPGDKSDRDLHLPKWIIESEDPATWISALQPWCDGEGHVIKGATGVPQGFSMLQARHTDLDYEEVSSMLTCKDHRRTIAAGHLRGHVVHGIPVLQYCGALYRSEILMDVAKLFRKLGFHPRTEVARLFLKNDGLWSCHWSLKIPSHEVTRMATMGIIIQDQKRAAASVRK
jgi:hypothetical protein